MAEGTSFNQETTLAGESILGNIRKAKELGFDIKMYYVGLESADLAVWRVRSRVKKAIPLCDKVRIYDNTVAFRPVADFAEGIQIDGDIEQCKWLRGALF